LSTSSILLFPLQTVLFPGGPLPLRVFEPRYLDLVSRCMKEDAEFGVVSITSGSQLGDAETESTGTLARIADWYQGSDGILGVTAVGGNRFYLNSVSREDDGLYVGDVTELEPEPQITLPAEYQPMASLLEAIINDLGKLYQAREKNYQDATWVGYRFAEILPISLEQKQRCLVMNDPLERLGYVRPLLRSIRQERSQ
jgi:Lon protease-like protein